ncbi:MAG: GMC family oxidoreductase N-terminal domain-containing protein [Gammaproteobacteria bacterium]|nr:GMC family oxidoreductase N-terminal domain-containing protein [Gammaproteobacteria bacterium]
MSNAKTLLGAAPVSDLPPKYKSLDMLGERTATPAAVTIACRDETHFNACNHCGNCATGCNFGAKRSLDAQLLAAAQAKNDAIECFTGATVERVEPLENGNFDCRWIVHVSHTGKSLRARFPEPTPVRARWVIIAAGTFGSTELLMKSRSERLSLSGKLGEQFSTNGDMLAVGYNQTRRSARSSHRGRTPEPGGGCWPDDYRGAGLSGKARACCSRK